MTDPTSNANLVANIPERFDPSRMSGESIEAEHFARYRWAAQFAAGRRVLDAGCGLGYGSAILAQAGAEVVAGIDISTDAIRRASAEIETPNVKFESGDVTNLPYDDAAFDLVVCFEVIEHIANRDEAFDEFCRVLGPDGILVLSSPNRETYPPGNPHHVYEYVPSELAALLEQRFPLVTMYRQHTWISSGILDDENFTAAGDSHLRNASIFKLASNAPGRELYSIAIASIGDQPGASPVIELSEPVELRKWDQLWHQQDDTLHQQMELLSERERLIASQEQEIRSHVADLARAESEMCLLGKQLTSAERELARVSDLEKQIEELAQLNTELIGLARELESLQELRDKYEIVVQSTSWQITRPLRQIGMLLRRLRG